MTNAGGEKRRASLTSGKGCMESIGKRSAEDVQPS